MADIATLAEKTIDNIKKDFCYTIEKKVIGYMEPYVLKDTGDLRASAYATSDTQDGSVVVTYDTDYAEAAYSLPVGGFTPTTPGTTSHWDKAFEESFEYQLLLHQLQQDVTLDLQKLYG